MKLRTLIAAILALGGCALPVEMRASDTLDAWVASGLPMGEACDLGAVTVEFVPDATAACEGVHTLVWACFYPDDLRIIIDDDAGPDSLDHELRHYLSLCTYGDSDHDHARKEIW